MDFKIVKKGYDITEVDAFVKNTARSYEQNLSEQKNRINELRELLGEAENSIKGYKEKSGLVTRAIYNAVAKAEEIERLSKLKYLQEIEQLKAFHEKWMSYYNRILEKYPLDDDLIAAGKFNLSMKKILSRTNTETGTQTIQSSANELEKNYLHESKRLQEKRIGYITVNTDKKIADDENIMQKMVPGADLNSPILSGEFDPIERINRYLASEKSKEQKADAVTVDKKKDKKAKEFDDRSESGFSFEEALNPTQDLSDIMKDLGLLLED